MARLKGEPVSWREGRGTWKEGRRRRRSGPNERRWDIVTVTVAWWEKLVNGKNERGTCVLEGGNGKRELERRWDSVAGAEASEWQELNGNLGKEGRGNGWA